MEQNDCAECPMRLKYDNRPKSLTGRFWRWLPGLEKYRESINPTKLLVMAGKYNLQKYL